MLGVIIPVTPAANPRRAGIRAVRIGLRVRRVLPGPIPTPFPNVASHVVQAVAVGRKGTDRRGVRGALVVERGIEARSGAQVIDKRSGIAVIIGLAVTNGVHIRPWKPVTAGAAASAFFPLSLRRQPVAGM